MAVTTIDAQLLSKMFLAGANALEAKKEWINELNVFPVPDGDTGTNMTLTIMSAAKDVASMQNPTMEEVAKAISSGSLRGARGNSGVILSQLFRGFTKVIREKEEIDIPLLAEALKRATETAYKAVMKPKEGTILTVARGMSDKASSLVKTNKVTQIDEFIELVIKEGDITLENTPELLPVLKQAGVVDSGGQGLMVVLKGAYEALMGKEVFFDMESTSPKAATLTKDQIDTSDIKFGYCTEFIVQLEKEFSLMNENQFKEYLTGIGDSIVVVSDDDIVKVHVHTNNPGLAIEKALTYGSLTSMKIDNMREEHQERVIMDAQKVAEAQAAPIENKEFGFIAVSVGEGLSEIFSGLGVDYLIEGGQTMNPSTEDFLLAIEKVHADVIYLLPNNKNIILAAEQAAKLTKDKKIYVIPSKTIPQGITALISFSYVSNSDENFAIMSGELANVKSGQITYAVRNTSIDGKEIHENDIMGIGDAGILAVGQSINETTIDTIANMVDDDSEIICVYYGSEIKEDEASVLEEQIAERFPNVDIDVHYGGQPIYYYFVSVE